MMRYKLVDEDDNILCQGECKSLVGNFVRLLNNHAGNDPNNDNINAPPPSLSDTGGTSRIPSVRNVNVYELTSPAANSNYGILLGQDDGTVLPLAVTNFSLGTPITHGTGTNQLLYGATVFSTPSFDNGTKQWSWDCNRNISNGS